MEIQRVDCTERDGLRYPLRETNVARTKHIRYVRVKRTQIEGTIFIRADRRHYRMCRVNRAHLGPLHRIVVRINHYATNQWVLRLLSSRYYACNTEDRGSGYVRQA
jgi:hypothetical protein